MLLCIGIISSVKIYHRCLRFQNVLLLKSVSIDMQMTKICTCTCNVFSEACAGNFQHSKMYGPVILPMQSEKKIIITTRDVNAVRISVYIDMLMMKITCITCNVFF